MADDPSTRGSSLPEGGLGPAEFATWITEDVSQRLYAARQDIADAAAATPEHAFDADELCRRLLQIIGALRELAAELGASDGPPTSQRIEELAQAVGGQCESARALVAEGARLLSSDVRLRDEHQRLDEDAARLRGPRA